MSELAAIDAYGTLIEPATVKIERLLPGPVERVWSYLVESDLRRQWLASGDMVLQAGAPFTFTWRNDELTDPPGTRPEGMRVEHSMESEITEIDPPHRIAFTWNGSGDVSIELEPQGDKVKLTLIHRRLPNRSNLLGVSAGWHGHLDLLVARVSGTTPVTFWENWTRLRKEYDSRLPA